MHSFLIVCVPPVAVETGNQSSRRGTSRPDGEPVASMVGSIGRIWLKYLGGGLHPKGLRAKAEMEEDMTAAVAAMRRQKTIRAHSALPCQCAQNGF